MAVTTAAVIGAGVAVKGSIDQKNASKDAIKAQGQQNAANADFLKSQAGIASAQATQLFDAANINRDLGFRRAFEKFSETIPQQLNVTQQGNVGAQQQLLAGLPQIQNAILGLPTDFSQLQPRTLDFDDSFTRPRLPKFATASNALLGSGGFSGQQFINQKQLDARVRNANQPFGVFSQEITPAQATALALSEGGEQIDPFTRSVNEPRLNIGSLNPNLPGATGGFDFSRIGRLF